MEKITNKSALEFVLAAYGEEMPVDVSDKLKAMIVSLDKRAKAPRNPSAEVLANKALRVAIVNAMEPDKWYSINDLISAVPELATASVHKVSALLTPLKNEGLVERTEIKRKAHFRKVSV